MDAKRPSDASEKLSAIIESANKLGVEISEVEALQWLSAMAADSDTEMGTPGEDGADGSNEDASDGEVIPSFESP